MKENVILIWADEMRADTLGCFDNQIIRTPNIDKLAKNGVRFEQCMVTQPTCTPCRGSVLTGCYPSAIRSRMVGCITPDDPRFITKGFLNAGYYTASIGKIHLAPQVMEPKMIEEIHLSKDNINFYGFSEVDLVNGHGADCFGPQYTEFLSSRINDYQNCLKNIKPITPGINQFETSEFYTYEYPFPAECHSTNYITRKSCDFLQRQADSKKPFFLNLSFNDPHHPFTIPEPYVSMYNPGDFPAPIPAHPKNDFHHRSNSYFNHNHPNGWNTYPGHEHIIGTPPLDYSKITLADWKASMAVYAGMITMIDTGIGQILETMEKTNLKENTYIVFLSDHGDYMGDHGLLGKGYHYDSVIRTPLIISGPDVVPHVCDDMATVLDIAPTLLELCGINEPEGMQGRSMVNVLMNSDTTGREVVLTESDDDIAKLRFRTITTRDWKLIFYLDENHGELYDRNNDPKEINNLFGKPEFSKIELSLKQTLMEEILRSIDTLNGRVQEPQPAVIKWT